MAMEVLSTIVLLAITLLLPPLLTLVVKVLR
jgi:hypothetical protein